MTKIISKNGFRNCQKADPITMMFIVIFIGIIEFELTFERANLNFRRERVRNFINNLERINR